MKRKPTIGIFRTFSRRRITLFCFFLLTGAVLAQSGQPAAPSHLQSAPPDKFTIPALFVSDIHFEPFWDPGKVQSLAAAPVSKWKVILAVAPTPDRQARFDALRKGDGTDTPFPLLESSLKAMQDHAAGVKFVIVSGDLISHDFFQKYKSLFPQSTPSDYRAFVEKTVNYVIDELYGSFPGAPIYVALGNNDSDCGDYQLDVHSEFLAVTGKEVIKGFPASERKAALETFTDGGYYSVSLPAPMAHARLLVLNDIFMSKKYATCAGKADPTASDAQISWLQQQLAEARRNKEKVWVMAHIPPGVDPYSTATKQDNVCSGQGPEMFLSSEKLADVLSKFDDVVELAIFAHTHMDELRLLIPENKESSALQNGVALKMVPSISPIDGNNSSFTVARIDPATAALVDYRVFAASNQTGVDTAWVEEYDFAQSFHKSVFSSSSVSELIAGFAADPGAKSEASQDYIRDFSVDYLSPVLKAFWPQYVCSLSNHTADAYRLCVCPTAR